MSTPVDPLPWAAAHGFSLDEIRDPHFVLGYVHQSLQMAAPLPAPAATALILLDARTALRAQERQP